MHSILGETLLNPQGYGARIEQHKITRNVNYMYV